MTAIGKLTLKLGDRVRLHGEDYGGIDATIIGIDPRDTRRTYCVGWKQGETRPSGIRTHITGLTEGDPRRVDQCQVISDISKYTHYCWVEGETDVSIGVSAPTGGMFCADKTCNTYNEYAVPNQKNGTYKCFSCRGR
jgi:hypothetical protein